MYKLRSFVNHVSIGFITFIIKQITKKNTTTRNSNISSWKSEQTYIYIVWHASHPRTYSTIFSKRPYWLQCMFHNPYRQTRSLVLRIHSGSNWRNILNNENACFYVYRFTVSYGNKQSTDDDNQTNGDELGGKYTVQVDVRNWHKIFHEKLQRKKPLLRSKRRRKCKVKMSTEVIHWMHVVHYRTEQCAMNQ